MGEVLVSLWEGVVMSALLVEAVHVELSGRGVTWRTKEVYFWCLKYWGSISEEKRAKSLMTKPCPPCPQATMSLSYSRWVMQGVLPAWRRCCGGRQECSSSSPYNINSRPMIIQLMANTADGIHRWDGNTIDTIDDDRDASINAW